MAFGFRMPNIGFRKRMSWFDFSVAVFIGVIAGVYTFKPGLQDAKNVLERREALIEIQARRKAELERGPHSAPFIPLSHAFSLSALDLQAQPVK